MLGLPLARRSVIEVGAGIGDHTTFFLDRECSVLTSDGRAENVELLRRRYPWISVRLLDVHDPDPDFGEQAEIVYCYGTLYHLTRPADALRFLAACCTSLMLVETCVSFGDDERVDTVEEKASLASQAISGMGSRPTAAGYTGVYVSYSRMCTCPRPSRGTEFPVDWTEPPPNGELMRAIFVASRKRLRSRRLTKRIPERQQRD